MLLSRLLTHIPHELKGTASDPDISGIVFDSRLIQPGDLFVALRGLVTDGHTFIDQAIARECSAVVVEEWNSDIARTDPDIPIILVKDSRLALGHLAAEFFAHPATNITMIGITGTNGKTTTTWMIEAMLIAAGKRPGVIGTVNYRYLDNQGKKHEQPAEFTTPEPVRLHRLLREMADNGVTHVVMEVSSHALAQERLNTISFDTAVFTNLSRDHLDFHHDIETYFAAKQKLFTKHLKPKGTAVVLVDLLPPANGKTQSDPTWGKKLVDILNKQKKPALRILSCGFSKKCAVRIKKYQTDIHSISCDLSGPEINCTLHSNLVGRYNVLNLLTAAGTGVALGIQPEQICTGLSHTENIPGRLERVALPAGQAARGKSSLQKTVFIDYAHTPDALENVLLALREITDASLICVFGCGGDRDPGKRPLMGKIAGQLAEAIIITTDNPRSEDPETIIKAIEKGILQTGLSKKTTDDLFHDLQKKKPGYTVIEDRGEAIHSACSMSGDDDVILIAGKGHEDYQIIGNEKKYFDDRCESINGLLCWNIPHLLAATNGRLVSGEHSRQLLKNISTDSRSLKPGDIFLALSGANFDGHDYVGKAARRGAGAIIVSRWPEMEFPVPVIVVDDSLQALGDLAMYRRKLLAPNLKVAAITGSTGKTTVKEMTAAIFDFSQQPTSSSKKPPGILKTQGNFNNLIGLPLSLLPVNAYQTMAILEMGMNSPGEIARLTEIADPDYGLITNIQSAHIEGLGSIAAIAQAKGELFQEINPEGLLIVNLDDDRIRALAGKHPNRKIGFAVTEKGRRHKPDVKATRIKNLGVDGMRFTLHLGEYSERLSVQIIGLHNVSNFVAAAAIASAAGIVPQSIVQGLKQYEPTDKRLEFVELSTGIRVVNDSYNANPSSMKAALDTVASFQDGYRKLAILGDMLELGITTEIAHLEIGRQVAEHGYDYLLVTGEYANVTAHGAVYWGMDPERIHVFTDTKEIADFLGGLHKDKLLTRGDWLLIKGSRGMHMENVLKYLQKSTK